MGSSDEVFLNWRAIRTVVYCGTQHGNGAILAHRSVRFRSETFACKHVLGVQEVLIGLTNTILVVERLSQRFEHSPPELKPINSSIYGVNL